MVGGGLKSFDKSEHQMVEKVSPDVMWFQNIVTEFKPEDNKVKLICGREIEYQQLVIALGLDLKWQNIDGLTSAFENRAVGVCSNYSAFTVEKTWENIQRIGSLAKNLEDGADKLEAIFTQPNSPVKCAGAPQKIMYIAWDHWRKMGVLDKINITFHTGMPSIFSQPEYAKVLKELCEERGIEVCYNSDLIRLDYQNNFAIFQDVQKSYDMIHVVPPQGPLEALKKSPLSNEIGWIDVDPETLQHAKYPNIWSLGDCSSLPTSKTAAAVAAQCAVLEKNLISAHENEDIEAIYDGYTSCPLVTSRNEVLLAEFNYQLEKQETFWFDQSKPSRFAYFLKGTVLPKIYWLLHCRGHWNGPKAFRNVLNPGERSELP
jgi:sulfide:quinone oxidoreductase